MKTKVTDQLVCQLTKEWVATLPYRYPVDREEPHQFSQRFLDRMEPILEAARKVEQAEKRARRLTTKATAAILAALLGASIAMAYAIHYFRMVQMKYEKYSTVDYEQVGEGDGWEEFVPYHITYVPEGFTQTEKRMSKISYEERYEGYSKFVLVFNQTRIDQTTFFVDTEGVEAEEILLNGNQLAFCVNNKTYNTIYWNSGINTFQLTGNVEKDLLVKIAESVEQK